MSLHLYNTLTRRKEEFTPLDPARVRMYVCGPTVYDVPHLGNARSAVVYDVLFRVLRHVYGEKSVDYVRNITDVDDKINAAAKAAGEPISALTERVTGWFHEDMQSLGVLRPTHEPRATAHIADMITMIGALIERGHAYESAGHVLFDVRSWAEYGALSGRDTEEQRAGARVEVEDYKRNPGDFVLWKPALAGDDPSSVFPSPWGAGRPGWHIECSAMSRHYLGDTFDIHGGGADLMFPHHENEIAQSRCASEGAHFARVWVHNGFLTVNGEKMSKSLGNFTTVRDVLKRGVKGEVIRMALMSTHYRSPLNWTEELLTRTKEVLDIWYRRLANPEPVDEAFEKSSKMNFSDFTAAVLDDLNLPKAFSHMHVAQAPELYRMGKLLGIFNHTPDEWFKGGVDDNQTQEIEAQIAARNEAKKARNFAEADRIRAELAASGILLEDKPGGVTEWRRG